MKPAAFEDKEYEASLYKQLESGNPNVWSPGQVFEAHLGFDHAALVQNPRFWQLIGRTAPVGAFLNRYDWGGIWRHRSRRPMPNFRLNLFLQAKRPGYYKRTPRHIRAKGMNGPSWCFDVDADQQSALERVAKRLGNKVAMVYASPAFHTASQLYAHIKMGTILDSSTFPEIRQLAGHSKWFYDCAGGNGIANAEPEYSEGRSLYEIIRALQQQQSSDFEIDATREILNLSNTVVEALDVRELHDNPRVALFLQEVRVIDREISQFEQIGQPVRALLRMSAFTQFFNLEWYTIK